MSISDELQKLEALLRNGSLSHEEFDLAKRKILEGGAEGVQHEHLREIKAQNELAQLDREWQLEREHFMIAGKYGHKHIPGRVSSVIGGVFVVCFGVVWTVFASAITGFGQAGVFSLFPLFGVLFVLFGGGMSVYAFIKAGEYQKAHAHYHQRRQELIDQQSR